MSQITVKQLRKEFQIYKHNPGLFGAVRNIFSTEYSTLKAVDGVDFQIEEGEFVGYLGPNGAGKSTTIKMLTGILHPTSGEIDVNGIVPFEKRKENAKQIGVVFGQRTQLWWDLPPSEAFELLGLMYKVDPKRFKENLDFYVSELELADFYDTPVRKLSLGQKMRCELTAALLHDPKVLFLDEPTIGLDVVAKDAVRRFLKKVNREMNTTILLTTHDLDDVEALCERVIVIDKGCLVHDGSVESLKERYGNFRELVIDFAKEYEEINLPKGANIFKREGKRVSIRFQPADIRGPELISTILSTYEIHDLSLQDVDIEEAVKNIYEQQFSTV